MMACKFRLFILFILFGFASNPLIAQRGIFPNGVYLDVAQLRNKTPAFNIPISIVRKWDPGRPSTFNYYQFESMVDSIDSKYIRYKVFAFVENDSLYINTQNNSSQLFSRALTQGNFIVYRAKRHSADAGQVGATMLFGVAGYLAYEALEIGTDQKPNHRINIISLRTGNLRAFTTDYVNERLLEYPELSAQFNKERKKSSLETLLKYIDILNNMVSNQ